MGPAHRYRHPADLAGDGIPSERRTVQRPDRNPLAKAEIAQPFAIGGRQGRPVYRRYAGGLAERQVI